jgi:hypothetical protein
MAVQEGAAQWCGLRNRDASTHHSVRFGSHASAKAHTGALSERRICRTGGLAASISRFNATGPRLHPAALQSRMAGGLVVTQGTGRRACSCFIGRLVFDGTRSKHLTSQRLVRKGHRLKKPVDHVLISPLVQRPSSVLASVRLWASWRTWPRGGCSTVSGHAVRSRR